MNQALFLNFEFFKKIFLPVVGSSKNIKLGFVNNSTPIEALLRSPPDTPLIKLLPIRVF